MTTIERLRREQGLDQLELARRAGLAQSTVSRVERGGELTATTALALARVLGVTVEELLADRALPSTDGADLAATGS